MNASLRQLVQQALNYWQQYEWPTETPPDPEEVGRVRYTLDWVDAVNHYEPQAPLPSVADARYNLGWELHDYILADKRNIPLKVVRAQPGLGKTYAAIEAAQIAANHGKRILYLMPTHDHWDVLRAFEHFDPDLWYHWLGYNAPVPGAEDETMCKYAIPAEKWMGKGYPLMGMCDSLCAMYKTQCPYRQQALVNTPIIAGVHEHAVTGLAIGGYRATIIDEMPLRAFLSPREVPLSGIVYDRAGVGPLGELQQKMLQLAVSGRVYKGRALLEELAGVLPDVFALFDEVPELLPSVPWLTTTDDIDEAGFWYWDDLLPVLAGEWAAFKQGLPNWMERVILSTEGLTILKRGDVWRNLPKRTVIVDATANEEMYRQMFPDRKVEVYEPEVAMKGKIYQVTGRYNGIRQIVDGDRRNAKLASSGQEMIDLVKAIIEYRGYRNPAVITFMGAEPYFAEVVGKHRVGHFYGQRGTNAFADADGLFVVGTPSPPDWAIQRDVAILNQTRLEPFQGKTLDNGQFVPIRSASRAYYLAFDGDGRQASRFISGFWHDNDLRAMSDARREEELIQAIHRGRPLTRDVDVWLLSSIPIGERLAGIYDTPEEAIGAPEGISWKHWLRILEWKKELKPGDTIGYEEIAEAIGVAVSTVQKGKWLDKLVAHPDFHVKEVCYRPKTISIEA